MAKSHPRVSGGSGGSYSHLNMNDWQNALAEMKKASFDAIPAGWKTAKQIAQEMGISTKHVTCKVIPFLAKQGKVETKKFKIVRSDANPYPVPHYRLIK